MGMMACVRGWQPYRKRRAIITVAVDKNCLSCAFSYIDDDCNTLICQNIAEPVMDHNYCDAWQMSENLEDLSCFNARLVK